MPSINPKKLRVAELKKELESRGIDVPKSSKKPQLVALLTSALKSEEEQEEFFSSSECLDDTTVSEADGDSQHEKLPLEQEREAEPKQSTETSEEQTESMEVAAPDEPVAAEEESKETEIAQEGELETASESKEPEIASELSEQLQTAPEEGAEFETTEPQVSEEPAAEPECEVVEKESATSDALHAEEAADVSDETPNTENVDDALHAEEVPDETPNTENVDDAPHAEQATDVPDETPNTENVEQIPKVDDAEKDQATVQQEAENGVKQGAADEDEPASCQDQEAVEAPEEMETNAEPGAGENDSLAVDQNAELDGKVPQDGSKRQEDGEREMKPAVEEEKKAQSRKRPHDDQPNRQSKWEDRYEPPEEEPEEEFDDSLVVLDKYNCDLNFKVSRDRLGGLPLTMEGFAYLWAGARATYGVKGGKVLFECKVVEEVTVKHLPSDEPHPHVVRVGWSTNSSGTQLGEEELSYGYGGTGKFSVGCKFNDYGQTFHSGDVIGCYIDLSSDDNVKMFFTKNGEYLDVAFTEEKSKIQDEALFPHVLCKNTSVEVNFGQKDAPYYPNPSELDEYVFISTVSRDEMVRATKSPEARKDCEVLMMCGLPGAGKTYYTRQVMKDHPERKYNVLGTNAIMEKMRVMGVARKKNYAHRWEILIHNSNQCLNRLLQIACRKRRNYILDQTNVYATAQKRKMRPFEGFRRKAIVVVPTEEEYKERFDSRTKDEGKEVPKSVILEMKANFSLPEVGNLFEEVVFTELAQEEAEKLVEKYRAEGRKHGPPPEKRSRMGDNRNRGRDGGNWRQPRGFGRPPMYGNQWGGFGGGPAGFGRGGFGQPGFRGRGGPVGGGFGNQRGGFGRGGGRGDGRDNMNRRNDRGNNRGKRGWQDFGARGGAGRGGGYTNRQNQSRGFNHSRGSFQNASGGNQFQGRGNAHAKKFQHGNRMMQSSMSSSPHSARSYTYGHHHSTSNTQTPQQYSAQKTPSYSTATYTYGQQNAQQQQQQHSAVAATTQNVQAQQAYGQQNYSQQWAQYYQQQAQRQQQQQQYQNYYANYQQYYGQQAAQQIPRQ